MFKARRAKKSGMLHLRNLEDGMLYSYEVCELHRHSARLGLVSTKHLIIEPRRSVHIYLALIDGIDALLPTLSNLGLGSLSLYKASFSQRYEIKKERLHAINIAASEQSGRSSLVKIELLKDLDAVLDRASKDSIYLDFGLPRFSYGALCEASLALGRANGVGLETSGLGAGGLSRGGSFEASGLSAGLETSGLDEAARVSRASSLSFVIGPEGGFSREERARLGATLRGYSLGDIILRASSAAIFCASLGLLED